MIGQYIDCDARFRFNPFWMLSYAALFCALFLDAVMAAPMQLQIKTTVTKRCGGNGRPLCERFECIDGPWLGAKCADDMVCTRQNATYWGCATPDEYPAIVGKVLMVSGQSDTPPASNTKATKVPVPTPAVPAAPMPTPAPVAPATTNGAPAGKVCTYSKPNYKDQLACTPVDAAKDNLITADTQSIAIATETTLLLLCKGKIVTSAQSIPSIAKACGDATPLKWKAVGKSALQLRNQLMIFQRTEFKEGGQKFQLSQTHMDAAAHHVPPAISFWTRWVSNGLVEMEVVPRIITDRPAMPLKMHARMVGADVRDSLPARGEFDGVYAYYSSQTSDIKSPTSDFTNCQFNNSMAFTSTPAFVRVTSENKILAGDDIVPTLQQQWNYEFVRRYVKAMISQIQAFNQNIGRKVDKSWIWNNVPLVNTVASLTGDVNGNADCDWTRHMLTNTMTDGAKGIPLDVLQSSSIRLLLKQRDGKPRTITLLLVKDTKFPPKLGDDQIVAMINNRVNPLFAEQFGINVVGVWAATHFDRSDTDDILALLGTFRKWRNETNDAGQPHHTVAVLLTGRQGTHVAGVTMRGTVCRSGFLQNSAVVHIGENDEKSARILSHELGHSLGLEHERGPVHSIMAPSPRRGATNVRFSDASVSIVKENMRDYICF